MIFSTQIVRLTRAIGLTLLAMTITPVVGFAQNEEEVSILDNSFFIEEAYNQEPGVIQHIFNLMPAWEHGVNAQRDVNFLFTQEWPIFSQRHQFSYSIPLQRYDQEPPGGSQQAGGLGDIFLNYRYQLLNDLNGDYIACAPRASLILPSGDPVKGLGNGVLGYEIAFPVSKTLERWELNFNAGLTKVPGAKGVVDPDLPFAGTNLDGNHVGGSAVYFLRPNFHLMLEHLSIWTDELNFDGTKDNQYLSFVLPGFRWAPYTEGETQWVLGLGLPLGLSDETPDVGIFFYMSFEHRFCKKK
ncbi:MAG: hypothetical protein JXB10_01000 [Pirellulales bacterium]|nr:hypothetical protein [Pirellulales bacterium]